MSEYFNRSFERIINLRIEEVLNLFGYTISQKNKYIFEKENKQIIYSTYYSKVDKLYDIGFDFALRINEVEELWENYSANLDLRGKLPSYTLAFGLDQIEEKLNVNLASNKKNRIEENEQSLSTFLDVFKGELELIVNPFLNKLNDINTLDKYINSKIDSFTEMQLFFVPYGLPFRKIIIAKLSGNPDFDKIYRSMFELLNAQFQKKNESKYKVYLDILNMVYEDLK